MYSDMQRAWIWLSSIEGLGAKRFYKLLSLYEDPREVWDNVGPHLRFLGDAVYDRLVRARSDGYIQDVLGKLDDMGARAVTRTDDEYPAHLTCIFDPPPTLFVRGRSALNDERPVAMVGSRRCTQYGRRAAHEYAQLLAQQGVTVVSGAARGIDTCAHAGALSQGARTIAVLGCGVDVVYPPENADMLAQLLECGGSIVSEYMPGTPPLGTHFPARNRIISGMCVGVLLVEGAKGSGGMITVDFALEQGRDVFALPGSVFSPQSACPNSLIRQGAIPALSPWDILVTYGWAKGEGVPAKATPPPDLDEREMQVVTPLLTGEQSFDELMENTNLSVTQLNSLLTMLELRGIIKQSAGRLYRIET